MPLRSKSRVKSGATASDPRRRSSRLHSHQAGPSRLDPAITTPATMTHRTIQTQIEEYKLPKIEHQEYSDSHSTETGSKRGSTSSKRLKEKVMDVELIADRDMIDSLLTTLDKPIVKLVTDLPECSFLADHISMQKKIAANTFVHHENGLSHWLGVSLFVLVNALLLGLSSTFFPRLTWYPINKSVKWIDVKSNKPIEGRREDWMLGSQETDKGSLEIKTRKSFPLQYVKELWNYLIDPSVTIKFVNDPDAFGPGVQIFRAGNLAAERPSPPIYELITQMVSQLTAKNLTTGVFTMYEWWFLVRYTGNEFRISIPFDMSGNYLDGENRDRSRQNVNPLKVLFALGAKSVVAGLDENATEIGAMGPTYELLQRAVTPHHETDAPQGGPLFERDDREDEDGEEEGDGAEGDQERRQGGGQTDQGTGRDRKRKGREDERKGYPSGKQPTEGVEEESEHSSSRPTETTNIFAGKKRPAPIEVIEPPSSSDDEILTPENHVPSNKIGSDMIDIKGQSQLGSHTFAAGIKINGEYCGPYLPSAAVTSLPIISDNDMYDTDEEQDHGSNTAGLSSGGRSRKNTKTPAKATTSLKLGSYVDSGSTWDVYTLDHTRVVKLTAPSTFNLPGTQSDASDRGPTESEARRNIIQEDRLYRTNLVPLIGQVVPRYYGLYGCVAKQPAGDAVEVWAMMLENAGQEVVVEDLSPTDKQSIVECYRALHEAGVYHNDVGTRNWLRANDGTFRIIDFEKSTLFSQVDKNYWEYWKGMEMDRVAAVLQLD